jgi:X-Pro dipeptidyl-peptidase-like protein
MKYFRSAFFRLAFFVLLVFLAFQLPNLVVAQVDNPVEIKLNPKVFDPYVGQYESAEDAEFIFSFFRDGDKFYGQVTDQRRFEIFPASYPADPRMAGYQLMVASEIFRGRYLKSFENPAAIVSGQVNQYTINLHGNDYSFLKGHRIMVQVQSSWFPLYDRNPQKFVENIFLAKESDFQAATQRIYRSRQYPSRISVAVAASKKPY